MHTVRICVSGAAGCNHNMITADDNQDASTNTARVASTCQKCAGQMTGRLSLHTTTFADGFRGLVPLCTKLQQMAQTHATMLPACVYDTVYTRGCACRRRRELFSCYLCLSWRVWGSAIRGFVLPCAVPDLSSPAPLLLFYVNTVYVYMQTLCCQHPGACNAPC
jgi:hypothetical protein